mmetsp:Transcript_16514/g.34905  ORF Transcript_16514/g.34905 Transcript_16514/m.34905 type:complete len:217 (+) Transcript_16514:46-696(+)
MLPHCIGMRPLPEAPADKPHRGAAVTALSSSWPGAFSPVNTRRWEPPRAPKPGPTAAHWDPTPLALPAAPKEKKWSSDGSSTTALEESGQSVGSDSEEELDKEPCIFSLDGDMQVAGGDGDEGGEVDNDALGHMRHTAELELTGLDDDDDGDFDLVMVKESHTELMKKFTEEVNRWRSKEVLGSPPLGASPVLRSVLECMAREAAGQDVFRRQATV